MASGYPLSVRRRVFLLLPLLVLVGCGSGSNSGGGFSARKESGAGSTTLRLAMTIPPTTLDPAKVQDVETPVVLSHVFETLVQYDEDSKIAPGLAESWSVSPDGTVYTFKLREAKFSNGKAFTSKDVRASFERTLSPALASPVATTYLGDIGNAKSVAAGKSDGVANLKVATPDPRTVVVTLEKPFGAFLGKLTYPAAAIVDVEAVGVGEITKPERAIGTGPFRIAAYEPERKLTLAPNPEFYGPTPKLAGIEFAIVRDGMTRLNLYRQGNLDLLTLDRADIRGVTADAKLGGQIRFVERPSVYYLLFNPKQYKPFARREVRRAFTMALDRGRLAREVLGALEPADRWVPPSVLPRRDGLTAVVPAFDPKAARAELEAAGLTGAALPPLTLCYRADNADARAVAETVTSDLKTSLGLRVEPRAMDWGALLKARNKAELPSAYLNWTADYVDPENFLSTLLRSDAGVNFDRWTNPEFDRLTARADASADPAERVRLYQQAEEIVVRELPRMPLYFGRDAVLVNPRVKGLRTNALGTMVHLSTTVD